MLARKTLFLKAILALITCCSAAISTASFAATFEWVDEAPSHGRKSPCTFVFTHGLYGDGNQFRTYANAFAKFGCSSVLVTLPGHGADSKNSDGIVAGDWLRFLESVVTNVVEVSDHTYLVGQSTGGVLSAAVAHRNSLRSRDRLKIDGLWLIEPALRVRSGPGLGSCLFSAITSDVRNWPLMAGLFGVDIQDKTPKISPHMGCLVDSIWKTHLMETGFLKRDSLYESSQEPSHGYYELIEATAAAFSDLKIPTYVQNTIGDRMVDANVIKAALENKKGVRYSETNSPKHGQVVVDNILPDRDIGTLIEAGFHLPKVALHRHVRNLLEAVHSYRRAAELASERKENMSEFLAKYRAFAPVASTAACEAYVAVVDSSRVTDEIIPEFNACMISLQK